MITGYFIVPTRPIRQWLEHDPRDGLSAEHFFFNGADPTSVQAAWKAAKDRANGGRVSVWGKPDVAGPWQNLTDSAPKRSRMKAAA